MQITVLSAVKTQATSKAGKPYTFLELAYKGEDGQVKGKKVMPFGESKAVFDVLAGAGTGEFYTINSVKNEGTGYWDWIGAARASGAAATTSVSGTPPAAAGKVTGSNYETAEERAKKQVYIVRQSSITAALTLLAMQNRKTGVAPKDVIDLAKEFETFVFNTGEIEAPAALRIDDGFDNDIPL